MTDREVLSREELEAAIGVRGKYLGEAWGDDDPRYLRFPALIATALAYLKRAEDAEAALAHAMMCADCDEMRSTLARLRGGSDGE